MNNNKKSNKKIIIIIGISLVALLAIVLFLIPRGEEELKDEKVTLNCSFKAELPLMEANISMKVDYVNDEFKYVKEKYTFKLLHEQLINKIDTLEQEFEKKIKENFKDTEIEYSVEKNQNSIILNIEMDSEMYEKHNQMSKDLIGDESLNYSEYYYGAKSLEKFIENKNGECHYE